MNKRVFILIPLLLAFFTFSCNKETSYSVKLQNMASGPVRVVVKYDQSLAAPGQNTLKMNQLVYAGQTVEIYYNKGLGIKLPTMKNNDTLLQYTVDVYNSDSVPSSRNFRSLNNYLLTSGNKKNKAYVYQCKIFDLDFL